MRNQTTGLGSVCAILHCAAPFAACPTPRPADQQGSRPDLCRLTLSSRGSPLVALRPNRYSRERADQHTDSETVRLFLKVFVAPSGRLTLASPYVSLPLRLARRSTSESSGHIPSSVSASEPDRQTICLPHWNNSRFLANVSERERFPSGHWFCFRVT